jgi:hypothetical protein
MGASEIIENNKLIAEFMGFVEDDKIYTNKSKSNPLPPFWNQGFSNKCCEDDIRFHSSWDWLMPVLEKIESLGCKTVASQSDFNDNQYINIMTGISIINQDAQNPSKFMGQDKIKINAYYKAIVEFIKWINQNDTRRNQ